MKSIKTFFVSTKDYCTIFFDEPKTIKKSDAIFDTVRMILNEPLIITLSNIVKSKLKKELTNKKAAFKLFRPILNKDSNEFAMLYAIIKQAGVKRIKEKIMSDIYRIIKNPDSLDEKILEDYRTITNTYLKSYLNRVEIINKKFKGTWLSVNKGVLLYDNNKVDKTLLDNDGLIKMVLDTAHSDKPEMNIIKFLDNLLANPKKDIVDELFDFLQNGKFIIHEDGRFSAYKKVRSDYKDIYSGKVDNAPGVTLPKLNYENVDFNRTNVCSFGYHFCAYEYLSSYGNTGNSKIVEVRVNPKDVVAIPTDYNFQKGRCLTYEVIRDITDKGDCLNEESEEYQKEHLNNKDNISDGYEDGDDDDYEC